MFLRPAGRGSDKRERVSETHANRGARGIIEAKHLSLLMQANAWVFDKYGA